MNIRITLFGQLCDIAGSENIVLKDVKDTNSIQARLEEYYPALAAAKYNIAVDKKLILENTFLYDNNDIALLPPFSGG